VSVTIPGRSADVRTGSGVKLRATGADAPGVALRCMGVRGGTGRTGSRRLRHGLALLLATLAAALIVPAGASAVVVGIGDQKADMFSDPLFRDLGIRHARIAISYDALRNDWEREEVDRWMNAALAAGVEPLVAFWRSRVHKGRLRIPSRDRFEREFIRFRHRYPWVTTFASWNEANHSGSGTSERPALVAGYYEMMRSVCPTCTILAAEVLDTKNMAWWIRRFQKALGFRPRMWGLHNYLDANRMRTTGTRELLHLVRGSIWFTETGGVVARRKKHKINFPESATHAAAATRWLFDKIVPLSSRIKRVYLYHWSPAKTPVTWDSALLDKRGKPRPAWRVVRRVLAEAAVKRRG
jgi:hypothetical protein